MPDQVVNQLEQIPLFADLGRSDLRVLSKLIQQRQYEAGETICRQGQQGTSMYIVKSGELNVLHMDAQGIERRVKQLGPGDHFGQTSLLLGEPRDATVQAAKDSTLLSLNKVAFDELLHERPSVLQKLHMRPDVARKHKVRRLRFDWLEPDEFVIVSDHRHDIILARNLSVPILTLLAGLIGFGYWHLHGGGAIPLILSVIFALALALFILYLYADHRDEIYLVSNKRVLRRYHTPLGSESRVDAHLRNIQNIQEVRVGLLTQIFDFGDLIIETAGEQNHIAFREVPNPEGIREAIFEQRERLASGAKVQERDAIREDMQRYFDVQSKDAVKDVPPSEEEPVKRSLLRRILTPLQVFTYFMPSLWLEQGDTITWRKHWVALLKPIAPPTLLMLSATIVAILLLALDTPGAPVIVVYSIVIAIGFPWWLWQFDDWQNDIYQLTSTRIIDVERLPFYLREERREASLGMIQNVKFEIPGFLGKLLNYGSVTIETAGVGAFTFDCVKAPREVQAEIFRRMEAFQQRQDQAAAARHRSELLDWFAVYDQVRGAGQTAASTPSSNQET